LVIPDYKVDIWYKVSSLPDAFIFISVYRWAQAGHGEWKKGTGDTTKGRFGIRPTN
jgi:hypothetical protein